MGVASKDAVASTGLLAERGSAPSPVPPAWPVPLGSVACCPLLAPKASSPLEVVRVLGRPCPVPPEHVSVPLDAEVCSTRPPDSVLREADADTGAEPWPACPPCWSLADGGSCSAPELGARKALARASAMLWSPRAPFVPGLGTAPPFGGCRSSHSPASESLPHPLGACVRGAWIATGACWSGEAVGLPFCSSGVAGLCTAGASDSEPSSLPRSESWKMSAVSGPVQGGTEGLRCC